jgi:signal transduction histidine kinase
MKTQQQSPGPGTPVELAIVSLLVLTLLGSVLIPAMETQRSLRLLREISDEIEPARLLSWRLQSGLAMEYSALQAYALSGDTAQLHGYRLITEAEARDLDSLERLAPRLGPRSREELASTRQRITSWQALNRALFEGTLTPQQFTSAARDQRVLRDSIIVELDRLPSRLTAAAATRRAEVRTHEQRSLFVNAVLVCMALGAIVAVVALSRRERRLAALLQNRFDEEAAMRRMARALSEAVTIEEAMRRIVEGTVATLPEFGAYVEFAPSDDDTVCAAALLAGGTARLSSARMSREGSLSDDAMRTASTRVTQMVVVERRLPPDLALTVPYCTGLIAPLLSSGVPFGVLVLLRTAASAPFGDDERGRMELLADLAAAVLRRVEVEHAALAAAQKRATYETTLRKAAEALAEAFSVDEVTEQIMRSALTALRARGAYIKHIVSSDAVDVVVVRGATGDGVPTLRTTREYAGSYTQRAIVAGRPLLVDDPGAGPTSTESAAREDGGATIVLPLGSADARIGALFIVGAAPMRYAPDDITWAVTFGQLAALAYEKVRLIEEAREGRRELERVMRSRQRLIRGFSHDVKNPLGAADGYAELLSIGLYGELSEQQKNSIARVRRSIGGALALIDELHDLSRVETDNLALRRDPVDLGELGRASGDEYRGAAMANGLALDVDVAKDIPIVQSDGARVRQIVGNLLSNAIKYTKAGSITLRVGTHRSVSTDAAGDWVYFDVIDTGIGIPADKCETIFEEFSRLNAHDKPGAGLGLAISERLARALGGQIVVRSEVGHGSTFTLRIPTRAPESAADAPERPLMRAHAELQPAPTIPAPPHPAPL